MGPHSNHSQWFLRPVGPEGIFKVENVHTGTYANLDCYWCMGANVKMSTDSASVNNLWRIVSAWRKAPMQIRSTPGVALLDQSIAKKTTPRCVASSMPRRHGETRQVVLQSLSIRLCCFRHT